MGFILLALSPEAKQVQAFRIGVAGHSLTQGPYNYIGHKKEIDLIKSLGMNLYRSAELYRETDIPEFISLTDTLNGNGIDQVVIINPDPVWGPANEQAAYETGYALSRKIAASVAGKVSYYEAGNEYDLLCLNTGLDGSEAWMYDNSRFAKCKGMIRGIIDGVHAGDPNAKVIVHQGGWFHFGFQFRLWAEGVRWDITGFHWYSEQGPSIQNINGKGVNMFEKLQSFNRPLLGSEFNVRSGLKGQAEIAAWLTQTMTEWASVATKYNILGAVIYQLLEQECSTCKGYGLYDGTGKDLPQSIAVRAWTKSQNSVTTLSRLRIHESPSPQNQIEISLGGIKDHVNSKMFKITGKAIRGSVK
jgi:hypothetical protein